MRPIFIIYLAAGITLFFAAIDSAAFLGHAYMTNHAIMALKLEGDDLAKMQAAQGQELNSAAEGFVVALLQAAILISAWRFQKRQVPPNQSPEPAAVDAGSSAARPTRKVGGGSGHGC
jgi:hypothetical protein